MTQGVLKVVVDRDRCCGAGRCVEVAPTVFAQRDIDATGYVIAREFDMNQEAAVEEAAALCPVVAVQITRG